MNRLARMGLGFAVVAGAALSHTSAIADEPHGVNFVIKSALDTNFCIEAAQNLQTPEGRAITLQQCNATRDTQRWALTFNNDNNLSFVGSMGMCLDIRNRHPNDGNPVQMWKCHFGNDQRFTYTAKGQFKEVHSGKCLYVAQAAANAAVGIQDCNDTAKGQVFQLGH